MATIEHLEVLFDVKGDGDEKVFAEYFARCIKQWEQSRQQDQMLQARLRRDQMLGDDHGDGAFVC